MNTTTPTRPCRKASHVDRPAALRALVGHYVRFGDAGCRVYPCPDCGGAWHLGHSQPRPVERPLVVPASTFLSALRRRALVAAERLCQRHGRDPAVLLAIVVGCVADGMTAAKCEDVLLAAEAVEAALARRAVWGPRGGRRHRKAGVAC